MRSKSTLGKLGPDARPKARPQCSNVPLKRDNALHARAHGGTLSADVFAGRSPRGTTPGSRQARARPRPPPSKARERVLLVCAGLIILFAPSDVYAIGHFDWGPLIVRIEWAGSVLVTVLALRKVEPHGVPIVLNALAILSTVLYGALAWLTGGTTARCSTGSSRCRSSSRSYSRFAGRHRRLRRRAGALRRPASSAGPASRSRGLVRWMAQAVVVTSLVYTVSATYRRLRMRETPPPDAQDVAAARVRASEAAVAARDEFLAVAAHELRTPLDVDAATHRGDRTDAAGGERAGDRRCRVPPIEQKRIAAVARQARAPVGLIDSMLDVSKLTGGHLSLELAEVDVTALVREIMHRFAPDAARPPAR